MAAAPVAAAALHRRHRRRGDNKAPAEAAPTPPTPPQPPPHHPRIKATILVTLIVLAAYSNSLRGEFVFDDHFAVVENRDVSPRARDATGRPAAMPPLRSLLTHDFWGQDMSSEQSHKSYRPVTVLVFRMTAQLWRLGWGFGWWGEQGDAAANALPATAPSSSSPSVPPWLSPLPFHALAVLLHCLASAQVFYVALWLMEKRRRPSLYATTTPTATATATATTAAAAALAALLFALHPVHTEAVAGIVGSAEALAAILALSALRLYGSAADEKPNHHHWPRVALALTLSLLSALAKETGATVLGTMALYDVLVALPPAVAAPRNHRRQQRQLLRVLACLLVLALYVSLRSWVATPPAIGTGSSRASTPPKPDHLVRIYRRVENPIAFETDSWTRLFSTLHLHSLYAGLLVFPWRLSADWSFECVALTPPPWKGGGGAALHLHHHARWLCLYAALAWVVVRSRPLSLVAGLLRAWWRAVGGSAGGGSGKKAASRAAAADDDDSANTNPNARWRLFVAIGLIVAPFFPASNALFYVGTYIGERLLYLPSVGFCLLLADALFPAAAADADADAAADATPTKPRRRLLFLLLLLTLYATRTITRNVDWRDEPALFASALRVCPRSAKALLNSGVLARRRDDWDEALRRFETARQVDPTYCEVSYWVGLTLAERGVGEGMVAAVARQGVAAAAPHDLLSQAGRDVRRGMRELREGGVRCKYTAVQSVEALNRLYVQLQRRQQSGGGGRGAASAAPPQTLSQLLLGPAAGSPAALLASWASVLADPAVSRAAEACAAYEDAALAVTAGDAAPFCRGRGAETGPLDCVSYLLGRCFSALDRAERGEVAPDSLAEANLRRVWMEPDDDNGADASRRVARATGDGALLRDGAPRLKSCLRLRRPVYLAFAGGTDASSSSQVKRAAYAYLSAVAATGEGKKCRAAGASGGGGEDKAPSPSPSPPPSPHQRLVHALQAADPKDPWLQAEWAETLLAVKAAAADGEASASSPSSSSSSSAAPAATNKTAAKHFEAAALLLLRHVAKGGGGALDPRPEAWNKQHQDDDENKPPPPPPLAPLPVALGSAAGFLERRLQLVSAEDDLPDVRCALHQRLCHAYFHLAASLAAGEEDEDDVEAEGEAVRAGQRCARELERDGRCKKHAEELRRAVRFDVT